MNTRRKWTRSSVVAALVVAGGIMIHQAALAEEPTRHMAVTTHSETVRYDDLDLSEQAGLERLHVRITSAAKRACGPVDRRNQREHAFWQQCYERATSDAVAQVSDERFTQWADTIDASRTRPIM
jgi:UrcA family protein